MYTAAQFLDQLVAEFPELREDVGSEIGLLHNQMHAFTRLTNDAVAVGNFSALKRQFDFADRFFHHSEDSLENALFVSYLEDLDFTGPHGESAEALMSAKLRQGRREVLQYLDEVTRKPDAKRRDSPNA
jgi:hypothetical protein